MLKYVYKFENDIQIKRKIINRGHFGEKNYLSICSVKWRLYGKVNDGSPTYIPFLLFLSPRHHSSREIVFVSYLDEFSDPPALCFWFFRPQAVAFVTFLVGFITVLCIGNYFRAKRAQERQRQRRLAKLAAAQNTAGFDGQGSYEAPAHIAADAGVPA